MPRRPLLLIALVGVLTSACSGGGEPASRSAQEPSPSPVVSSAAPSPTPSPTPPAVDPLTGLAPRPTSPVVVVKIDNAGTARQYHRGLGRAAVVYQELVESGETRFAAVFSSASAGEVGPVRSVRESDIELLRQYGKVPVGFSGGNTGVKNSFSRAVRAGQLLDASYDAVPQDYRLGERRTDARNFFTSPATLALSRPGELAKDVGLRFGLLTPGTGLPAKLGRAVFSQYVTVTFTYDAATQAWSVAQNKRLMPGVAPANVIVQEVPIKMSRYVDVLGNRTPYTVTTGSGVATVFRDGRAIKGKWRRLTVGTGTRFVDLLGRDIPLRPGPTWVLLLPQGQPVTTVGGQPAGRTMGASNTIVR